MAFYFSSDTKSFYDTDVFPVSSLPANKVEISKATFTELMTKQNQGYVIMADGSGNPYAVNQSEAAATDIKHAASVATTIALGHVKIGNTMQAANDGTLDLKDGAVSTAKIADANVTAAKIATDAVETAKIKDANVTTDKIADGAVSTAKIADGAVSTAKIADGAVTGAKIEGSAITSSKIADGNVITDKLSNSAVTTDKIATKAVTTEKIASHAVEYGNLAEDSVRTSRIKDEAVTNAKLAPDSVTQTKIMDHQVVRSKLAEESCTSVLEFKDTSDNDLNGTTQRLQANALLPVLIGRTQLIELGDIVDFTISFDWGDAIDPLMNVGFKLVVWTGASFTQTVDRIVRDVSRSAVYGDNYALHCQERFTFRNSSGASDRIKVSIAPTSNVSWLKLVNIQLNGIRSPGYI